MNLVNLIINGTNVEVENDTTVLDAAKSVGIKIPSLCHVNLEDKMVNKCASCRVCMVESNKGLIPACGTVVKNGMQIKTHSIKAIKARRTVVELLLSNHPQDCLMCDKNGNCELQNIAADLGIREIKYKGKKTDLGLDTSSKSIVKNLDKCILCRRCETMCNEVQTVGALSGVNRGFETVVSTFFDTPMHESDCTFCGQCIAVCPTAALTEVNNTPKVWNVLDKKAETTVVQVAPAVRVAIGEEFGMEPGAISTGKLVAALKELGFKYVFDTNFAADLTIIEEASEFIHRLQHGGKLPMLTSCCPAWINFFEKHFEDLLDIPSSCKSPQEMFGSVAKNYFAPKVGIEPSDLTVVSVMPCVAKKYEAARPELSNKGVSDVDIVITTRELAKMIKEAGINFDQLEECSFDSPLGESTGASDIFGTTGGVLEAALRTAYEWVTNETLEKVDFTSLRGIEGIKEATVNVGGTDVNVAVASGLGNARKILEDIRQGKSNYHLIEIMACPGGCIGGAGQPYHYGNFDIVKKRSEALYNIDAGKELRKSHENLAIKTLYDEFLGEPYGETAHKYLHTHYFNKSNIFDESKDCCCELVGATAE
ncbi:NADH-dependent [FeFe] hydrogenase, group A6 [Romboutsia sp.]|uniref:NADH-dependent [FeFe] hydrogenase, group A6 n=1 Tax=Romboutsia sp. TaxID=1965302 RepID=UPI002CAD8CFE|nr:NADH-dependent [FeFe] hydrogenase, group A6 [Romboutsia sp.]HSQ90250.1 NADH-dependent [FeFe] hydrogenase, group A6 [Romboutsia sp.]